MTNFRRSKAGNASIVYGPKTQGFLKTGNKKTRLTNSASDDPVQTTYDVSDYMLSYMNMGQNETENAIPYDQSLMLGGSVFANIKPKTMIEKQMNVNTADDYLNDAYAEAKVYDELDMNIAYNNLKQAIMNNTSLSMEQKQDIIMTLDKLPVLRNQILSGVVPISVLFPDPQVEGEESFQVAAVNNMANQLGEEETVQANILNNINAGGLEPTMLNNMTTKQHVASQFYFHQEDQLAQ